MRIDVMFEGVGGERKRMARRKNKNGKGWGGIVV
jgi:hypothetical protein